MMALVFLSLGGWGRRRSAQTAAILLAAILIFVATASHGPGGGAGLHSAAVPRPAARGAFCLDPSALPSVLALYRHKPAGARAIRSMWRECLVLVRLPPPRLPAPPRT